MWSQFPGKRPDLAGRNDTKRWLMLENIPSKLGNANLICYLILSKDQAMTGNTRHWVGGQLMLQVYGLAICRYDDDEGYYLFYCNNNWIEMTDTYHDSIEDAKEQAEFEFMNTIESWITI